jgi:hypothetical protein
MSRIRGERFAAALFAIMPIGAVGALPILAGADLRRTSSDLNSSRALKAATARSACVMVSARADGEIGLVLPHDDQPRASAEC